MLDFFCSFDGCSISMSYRDWPSTMATRSSSACVALISMRFIVAFLARSTARNAMAFRYLGTETSPSRSSAAANAGRPRAGEVSTTSATSPRHAAGALLTYSVLSGPATRTSLGAGRRRVKRVLGRRTGVHLDGLTHRALAGSAGPSLLTWLPRGQWLDA